MFGHARCFVRIFEFQWIDYWDGRMKVRFHQPGRCKLLFLKISDDSPLLQRKPHPHVRKKTLVGNEDFLLGEIQRGNFWNKMCEVPYLLIVFAGWAYLLNSRAR